MSTVPDRRPCGALRARARGRGRGRRLGLAGLLALAWLMGACDYPTSSPKWYTEWLLPIKNTRLTGAQLLPASVGMVPDNSAFLVAVPPTTMTRTLGELCGQACTSASGSSVPKPAFTANLVDTLALPDGVAAAQLVSGSVTISITNGFGFDPLRPSATARGSVTILLTNLGMTLGRLDLSGTDTALPPGTTLTRDMTLLANPVAGGSLLTVNVASPAGDAVWIDANQGLTVRATASPLRVTDITVTVNQKPVAVEAASLDLSDIDQSLIDRVHGGTLVVGTDNPFPITGPVMLSIEGGGLSSPIKKALQLQTGQATQRIDFTLPELRSILGRAGLVVRGDGVVSGSTAVRFTPSQSVGITTELDLIVGPKEN